MTRTLFSSMLATLSLFSACAHAPAGAAKTPAAATLNTTAAAALNTTAAAALNTTAAVDALLHPPVEPYNTGFLDVGRGHSLYYEQSGNPRGLPVVFLHGGPGSGTKPKQRQFFDADAYRIVLYDQAGAGKSRSRDLLEGNDTWSLVRHLEKLREHLGIAKWLLFGGSWGSTLALAYAETYPEHVSGIITWGVFLGRPAEIDWTYKRGGVSLIHPEAFDRFESFIPAAERGDLVAAYVRRFNTRDVFVRREAVRRWNDFESVLSVIEPEPLEAHSDEELDTRALARARIESHYMLHHAFLSPRDNELLAHAARLRGIPITIVAGRYDMVCPIFSAFDLKARAPWSRLRILPLAGHASLGHAAVTAALVEEAADFYHSFKE